MSINRPVNIGLIGAGRIGSFHAQSVARRLVDANLVAIAMRRKGIDVRTGVKHSLAVPPACLE